MHHNRHIAAECIVVYVYLIKLTPNFEGDTCALCTHRQDRPLDNLMMISFTESFFQTRPGDGILALLALHSFHYHIHSLGSSFRCLFYTIVPLIFLVQPQLHTIYCRTWCAYTVTIEWNAHRVCVCMLRIIKRSARLLFGVYETNNFHCLLVHCCDSYEKKWLRPLFKCV